MKDNCSHFITKFILVFVIFIADQASKYFAIEHIEAIGKKYQYINSYLNLVLVHNKGISFGMFHQVSNSNLIFLIVALIIVSILGILLIKTRGKLISTAYIMIVGGALGNIFDRIERGAVVDFIEIHYEKFYWPAFNIADSCIAVGVFLALIIMLQTSGNNHD
jgi:signal peptidase II